jgi:hypothetical protein
MYFAVAIPFFPDFRGEMSIPGEKFDAVEKKLKSPQKIAQW